MLSIHSIQVVDILSFVCLFTDVFLSVLEPMHDAYFSPLATGYATGRNAAAGGSETGYTGTGSETGSRSLYTDIWLAGGLWVWVYSYYTSMAPHLDLLLGLVNQLVPYKPPQPLHIPLLLPLSLL